ncbi:phosphate signaling complex protein PhoU [Endozoicomonas sp. G2_2]|uniref:phosphate signaling complex protein PhoU n=1 Tax=Gammaproteobacteria TaxID=1236 RepID=UPI000C68F335|nr:MULTISPECIES: phosphate signaling complex protein PhoU [Gammaproteobacteria]MAS10857.1 phosphate transport system regulatory protein PhoU [Salinisphaera sp.]MBO9468973.1 phosphate signaling complex protein PhoU [Endozoicomonas sp. G2_2]|tara:strand:- start:25 stop:765 length:741 start_codon:yes stop_codon:yes gene_type:complete
MDKVGLEKHTSKQFDADLEDVREMVLSMGGLVEQQIADAVRALISGEGTLGEDVVQGDTQVNRMEVEIDEECTRILARRAPQAGDLRLIIAIAKTITDLERIGDEAEKIGRMATHLASYDRPKSAFRQIEVLGRHVREMLREALDAFARLDSEAAVRVAQQDEDVDREYEGIVRQGITYMMEDPRTIRHMLDVLWAVKALERIGDHSKNIGEYVVYFVEGKDVRHIGLEALEKEVSQSARRRRDGE